MFKLSQKLKFSQPLFSHQQDYYLNYIVKHTKDSMLYVIVPISHSVRDKK